MNEIEFAVLMTKLRARYQNGIADEALWLASIDQYWEELGSYNDSQLNSAFGRACREFPAWMPSAGQLAGLIDSAPESSAITAWPEVMRLARRSSGDHSDPIAREAIRLMGGGKRLGGMPQKELDVWGRKEFERLYLDVSERLERGEVLQLGSNGLASGQLERVNEELERSKQRALGNGWSAERVTALDE